MKDHTPNCEVRTIGSSKCTCGAPDERYPTVTTNGVTDVEVLGPRDVPVPAPTAKATKPAVVAESTALKLLRDELETFSLMDNKEAATVCRVLKRLIDRIGDA